MSARKYRDKIRFEVRSGATDSKYGRPAGDAWVPLRETWAEVQDVMPSKLLADETVNGLRKARVMSRVRIRYQLGLSSDMRIVEISGQRRTMTIISGPAALGGRRELEFLVEQFSS